MHSCEGKVELRKYTENIDQIKDILKGNISGVIKYLKEMMAQFAAEYKFEEANEIKEKLVLEKFQSRSTVVSSTITDVDVFTIDEDENYAFVNYLKVIKGAIVQTYTSEIKKTLDESKEELLELAIVDIRQKIFSNAKEILILLRLILPLKI